MIIYNSIQGTEIGTGWRNAVDEKQTADTTALPAENRPEVHQGSSDPISVEQDKDMRDGRYRQVGDERMRDAPGHSEPVPGVTPGTEGVPE